MFESKGVTKAAERLQLLVGDAREPFPQEAKAAQVRRKTKRQFRLLVENIKNFADWIWLLGVQVLG